MSESVPHRDAVQILDDLQKEVLKARKFFTSGTNLSVNGASVLANKVASFDLEIDQLHASIVADAFDQGLMQWREDV